MFESKSFIRKSIRQLTSWLDDISFLAYFNILDALKLIRLQLYSIVTLWGDVVEGSVSLN